MEKNNRKAYNKSHSYIGKRNNRIQISQISRAKRLPFSILFSFLHIMYSKYRYHDINEYPFTHINILAENANFLRFCSQHKHHTAHT